VSETVVVSDLGQETANRWNRILEHGSERLDHPAWLFCKKRNKVLAWLGSGWHDRLLIK
jgi:hypothetical protein